MPYINGQVELQPVYNEISKNLEYQSVKDYQIIFKKNTIIVPIFFSYDGATIPPMFWQSIYSNFDPIVMTPALIHDWLYSNHQINRDETDKLY